MAYLPINVEQAEHYSVPEERQECSQLLANALNYANREILANADILVDLERQHNNPEAIRQHDNNTVLNIQPDIDNAKLLLFKIQSRAGELPISIISIYDQPRGMQQLEDVTILAHRIALQALQRHCAVQHAYAMNRVGSIFDFRASPLSIVADRLMANDRVVHIRDRKDNDTPLDVNRLAISGITYVHEVYPRVYMLYDREISSHALKEEFYVDCRGDCPVLVRLDAPNHVPISCDHLDAIRGEILDSRQQLIDALEPQPLDVVFFPEENPLQSLQEQISRLLKGLQGAV